MGRHIDPGAAQWLAVGAIKYQKTNSRNGNKEELHFISPLSEFYDNIHTRYLSVEKVVQNKWSMSDT